ncbi:MAG TPA: zf-HC2 domain-containing protein [Acidobacteriaceae bacterium]|nr:zf-HC2 domain-containing protein [Acidobacteriaceae bacterium]
MRQCKSTRERFSAYLDGALSGVAMQQTAAHLEACAECMREFTGWRAMQKALARLGPAKAPADLALRLRVAISQEQAHTTRQSLARWQVRWQNTLAPFLLRASAGFASAVLLVGTAALLVGAFASPQPVEARDAAPDAATSPTFLYSLLASTTPFASDAAYHEGRGPARAGTVESSSPVIVEAYVNRAGQVYDYRIISGPDTPAARAQIENMLLFSVFEPARVFGEPVRGVAVLSFSGVSVQG